MDSIADFVSKDQKIRELEKEIINLNKKIDIQARMKRRYRLQYQQAKLKDRRPEIAIKLLNEREQGRELTIAEIARESRLSASRVKGILTEMRNNSRQEG